MFKNVKKQVLDQFNAMVTTGKVLFVADVVKEAMWDLYLDSFSPEEKQHHNCNNCKQFIRQYGGMVIIQNNKLVTVWDFIPEDVEYLHSIQALGNYVRNSKIRDRFFNEFLSLGTDYNTDIASGTTWEHFHVMAPSYVKQKKDKIPTLCHEFRTTKEVFKRGMDELTIDSIEVVLDLIAQDTLYRGKEAENVLKAYLNYQRAYVNVSIEERDNHCWDVVGQVGTSSLLSLRNTAIGTLLVDISKGEELDYAVTAYEKIMAPTNYKRSKPILSQRQIDDANKVVEEMGIRESLGRRFATPEDISVNNLLFVNRNSKKATDVFEELKEEVQISPRSFNAVAEITIDKFIEEVLPTVTSMDILVENDHLNNLVSVIAPKDAEAPNLMKWNNPFSWSYVNELTDSNIKERVKAAGGNVNGVIRVSMSWFNYDDLDIHVGQPNGTKIGFDSWKKPQKSPESGQLDVDMNAHNGTTREGVENITWDDEKKMLEGEYIVRVNQYAKREAKDYGFIVEIECNGELFTFENKQSLNTEEWATVCRFNYSKKEGIKFPEGVTSAVISKEKWGINTNRFQKVSMIMNSPNYWDGQIGNKHTIFVIEGAKNDETPRGFYNEFLNEDLSKVRKVFEVLGAKLKVEPSDRQITGLGFSSTQRNHIICRVDGKFKRTLKVTF